MREATGHDYPHSDLTEKVIGAAIKVHRGLGPGLLESAYEVCPCDELDRAGLQWSNQVPLPVVYEGRRLDCGYRMDLVVEQRVTIEIKCVDAIASIHEAQLLTYLRLSQPPIGLILNFNVHRLRDGIVRLALTKPGSFSASSAALR